MFGIMMEADSALLVPGPGTVGLLSAAFGCLLLLGLGRWLFVAEALEPGRLQEDGSKHRHGWLLGLLSNPLLGICLVLDVS